ncbi:CHC2 zinc finger domain-containing protein [Streptomyces sp. NPDC014733]|uniref:CHC2 zinc finger domain-containing protein n=1 Tax=Streptomyces sp. NPDC014733 TaxID=3364885 RepID=UPI0036F58424
MCPTPKPPIAELFAEFYPEVHIPKAGQWRKICCPVHRESNPSASVNLELNRWKCFVCCLSEDSYDVIMREREIGFRQAQEWASSRFGSLGEGLLLADEWKPRRGIHQAPRFGIRSREVRPGIRRFGENRA